MDQTKQTKQDKQKVDMKILKEVLDVAQIQANKQAHDLSAVARAVIVRASKNAKPSEDGVAHPAQRPARANQVRIRFLMDRKAYAIAKKRIRASGSSVVAALEDGLERYGRTGQF